MNKIPRTDVLQNGNALIKMIGLSILVGIAGVVGWKLATERPNTTASVAAGAKVPARIAAQVPLAAHPAQHFPPLPMPPGVAPMPVDSQPPQAPVPNLPAQPAKLPSLPALPPGLPPEIARQLADRSREIEHAIKNAGLPVPNAQPSPGAQPTQN